MIATGQRAKEIFVELIGNVPPEQWDQRLAEACGGDDDLRRRVAALLRAHREPDSFLNEPAVSLDVERTIDQPPERPGSQIGPYKLLEQIGEGGFGVVFMAEQLEPVRRKVALKVIKPGMDTRQVIARFEAERQALAVMDHPNIAKVLDAGETAPGRPYFVMELVRGIPITQYCDENNLPICERLELFASVCQAIQHAHTKGIIHRDIKPTNVLVTQQDGEPVVKVIDFGVAKAMGQQLTEKTLFTEFAQMIGTPLYMSPEQAAMSGTDIDTRSDIYSLGVLLYELLTGSTPVSKEQLKQAAFDEIRRIVREDEAQRPSVRIGGSDTLPAIAAHRHVEPGRLSILVRGELDWIVMKCLEKDRNRRYGTASGLAADVQRYLRDEPVLACPPSVMYQFRKFARRHKAAIVTASALGLAVLLMMVGLATSLFSLARGQRVTQKSLQAETAAKREMQKALNIETQAVERARQEAYYQNITLAHYELSVDNLGRARKHLDACPPELQRWEWRYLQRLCLVEPLILRDKAQVNCVAFSPTGDRLASGNKDGMVKIWDSRSGREIESFQAHSQSVASVALHPGGKHLATVGLDCKAKVWDLTTGREVFCQPCDAVHLIGTAHMVAFTPGPDSRELAIGVGGLVQIWDWRSKQVKRSFAGHQPRSIGVAFSRDGRYLATGDWRGIVKLWDAASGGASQPLRAFTKSTDVQHPALAVTFNPDGSWLAAASFNRRVDVWDAASGRRVHELRHRDGLVTCVSFSADGERIVSSGEDKTVHVWDAVTGREVLGLRGHAGYCNCVTFSSDGQRLASASVDKTIRVWDATPLVGHEAQEVLTFRGHENEIWTLAVSPDGQRVASAGFNTLAKVWDLESGRLIAPDFTGHSDVTFRIAWHPGGERLASGGSLGGNMTFKVWNIQNGLELFPNPVSPGQEFFTVVFSPPGGKYLVTGRADGTVQAWDAQTGALRKTLTHGNMVRGLTFSKDGRKLASLSWDGVVKVWDWDGSRIEDPTWTPAARKLLVRAVVPGPSSNIDISPDGRLAVGGEDNTVQIWDIQADQPLATLRGHSDDVYAVAFSPDAEGRWIATAGADSTVKVWDSRSGGRAVRTFRGHTALVSSLAYTPDGQRLVSGSRDHTVKVWDVSQLSEMPAR